MNRFLTVCTAAALALGSPAQESRPTTQPTAPPKTIEELTKWLAGHGVTLDVEAQTIAIDTEVGRPGDPIEYLLIHRKGKSHEAILECDVLPSVLNAALLALGFEVGENARAVEKDPLPTPEEVQAGAAWLDVFPPKGMQLWMTASWEFDGKRHEHVPIEELLLDLTTEEAVRDNKWIYLGGNWAPLLRGDPDVFVGDYAGNTVSACYMHPPNHLVTIDHERAADERNWWLTELVPPPGTAVRLTFHKQKPDTVKAREARLAPSPKDGDASEPPDEPKDR